jgi:hypothetical protein
MTGFSKCRGPMFMVERRFKVQDSRLRVQGSGPVTTQVDRLKAED